MTSSGALTVLHVDTERGWRGGQRQVYWLARHMRDLGHRPIVVARAREALAQRLVEQGIQVLPVRPVTEFDPFVAMRMRRVIRRDGVQLVHAHAGHAVALAALASRGTSARMIVTRRVNLSLRANIGTRWKYARADRIIAVSEAVAETLRSGGWPPDRVDVIPSGVDPSRTVEGLAPGTLEELGIPAGAPWVIQVGALDQSKDPLTFVRAIAAARGEVHGLHAMMCGEGPLRSIIEREIASLGLEGVVHLAGYRTDADALIAAANVATLSSEEEGLGTVLIDALALGIPVAATAAGGIPEVIEDGVSGLLVPIGEPSLLGAAIARLIQDEDLASRLSAAGRLRAAELSARRTAERTIEVYRKVLSAVEGRESGVEG